MNLREKIGMPVYSDYYFHFLKASLEWFERTEIIQSLDQCFKRHLDFFIVSISLINYLVLY